MGETLNPDAKNPFEKSDPSALGFSSSIPARYTMESHTPYAKNQANYGTCSAWAAAYGALTTAWAKSISLTDKNKITALSFCPYFVFNQVSTNQDCWGAQTTDIMVHLIEKGCKRFYMPMIGCKSTITQGMKEDGEKFKATEGFYLYDGFKDWDGEIKTEAGLTKFLKGKPAPDYDKIKKTIAAGTPVVFSTFLPGSFQSNIHTGDRTWAPTYSELNNPGPAVMTGGQHSSHAMILIGYDDNYNGGSFQVFNSWGRNWADGGKVWVKYSDWGFFTYGAYHMNIPAGNLKEMLRTKGCISGDCNNGYGVKYYDKGDRYEGHFKNGLFSGNGIYTFADGFSYAGEWKDDKLNGDVVQYYQNGDYGFGKFVAGVQLSGYGHWDYDNGDKFYGNLNSSKFRDGYGTLWATNGSKYSGEWKNNQRDGIGSMTWANGDKYIGEFEDNMRNGMGLYVKSSGKIMAGKWEDDNFKGGYDGYGYANTGKKALDPNFGRRIPDNAWASADCQSGDCIVGNGKRFYKRDSMVYEGEFLDGVENGIGTMKYIYAAAKGYQEYGNFVGGRAEGVVEISWSSGSKAICEIVNGRTEGYKLNYDPSGWILVTYYKNGEKIREVSDWSSVPANMPSKDVFGTKVVEQRKPQSGK